MKRPGSDLIAHCLDPDHATIVHGGQVVLVAEQDLGIPPAGPPITGDASGALTRRRVLPVRSANRPVTT